MRFCDAFVILYEGSKSFAIYFIVFYFMIYLHVLFLAPLYDFIRDGC